MTVRVLTAIDHRSEADVVARLDALSGVEVVRRCADLADLLAAAAAGLGAVALVSGALRGFDRDALAHLTADGVPVVGLVEAEADERRLRQLGVATVLATASPGPDLLLAIEAIAASTWHASARPISTDTLEAEFAALEAGLDPLTLPSDAAAPLAGCGHAEPDRDALELGTVIAVWGPVGSPGRTTIAVNVAAELALSGSPVLLVDADTYGASIGQVLGLLDESPGMAAAARAAELGTLDLPALARIAPLVSPGLRVLTGLPTPTRWPELRYDSVTHILALARALARYVVVDCGFSLEDDEELSYDTRAPRRNAATLATLADADALIAVGGADPIGLQRLVRAVHDLGGVTAPDPLLVVNRVRPGAVGRSPERRIVDSLQRFAGLAVSHLLPDDRDSVDTCLLAGRVLADEAPHSVLRNRLRAVAAEVSEGSPPPPARSRWRLRRHGSATMGRWSTA